MSAESSSVLPSLLGDITASYLSRLNRGDLPKPIPTGIEDLDRSLGGVLHRQELTVICGWGGAGKTTLVVNWAIAAAEEEIGVYFVSIQMSKDWVSRKTLSLLAEIDFAHLEIESLSPKGQDKLTQSQSRLESLPIRFEEMPVFDPAQICSKAWAIREQEKNFGLIIIDPIDPVKSQILHLRSLARQTNTAVVGLGTLRSDYQPEKPYFDFADTVIRLWREDQFIDEEEWLRKNPTEPYPKGLANIELLKNRSGPTGLVSLLYFERTGQFTELKLKADQTL